MPPLVLLALSVPCVLIAGAVRARHAVVVAAVAFACSVALAIGRAASGPSTAFGVRIDLVGCAMLILVCGIGAVIARYSTTYLRGEPGVRRYERWLLATLAAVVTLVMSNNLLVIAAAWTATSLALHQLLTFYRERPQAIVAAHKKFLVSRLADVCMWTAVGIVASTVGSLDLDDLAAWAGAHPDLPPAMQIAAILLVATVALRSAQLPCHGWLIQVMEAPTPVSALLHAGVVNIGGFVLIRLAPLMVSASAAQLILVAIGTTTAVIAALVMTTRVSVKVALAWSTCAQMGFMLVECGLGLWQVAFLHLLAHSVYKAHAFLSAGTAVERWRAHQLASHARALPVAWTVIALGFSLACAASACTFASVTTPSTWLLAGMVALAVTPLVTPRTLVLALVVVALYAAWHVIIGRALVLPAPRPSFAWLVTAVGLAILFAIKTVLQRAPTGALARRLYPWLFAGGYLDDRVSRLAFKIWPPRLGTTPRPRTPIHAVEAYR